MRRKVQRIRERARVACVYMCCVCLGVMEGKWKRGNKVAWLPFRPQVHEDPRSWLIYVRRAKADSFVIVRLDFSSYQMTA
jgi:hypothetical protein